MVQFDPLKYSFASHRNVVYARKGMACSTSPIASQVGLEILKSGGNAMDAAIAMATTLPLVEPTGNGLGSDCFALVWSTKDQKLFGLDGSGVAPMALSAEKVKEAGYTSVPVNGWLPTMVPGAGRCVRRAGARRLRRPGHRGHDYRHPLCPGGLLHPRERL